MIYKDYNILPKTSWMTNLNPPLSRYIIFEVSKNDQKFKFVFNHNLLNDMEREADGIKTDEDKYEVEAMEKIKECIDRNLLDRKMSFFELYSNEFILMNTPPDWFLQRNWDKTLFLGSKGSI